MPLHYFLPTVRLPSCASLISASGPHSVSAIWIWNALHAVLNYYPSQILSTFFCCIAINSPGNVEGALLAAFGHLILCPPCESTAVGQHSRSNKIIQIASYLRLQKLYYNYFFYFQYIAHPQIPQPSNHLVCQGTRTLERGWEVRTMGITTPGPGSQQGS